MSFRIQGLPAEPFAPLFSLTDAELAARGAVLSYPIGIIQLSADAVRSRNFSAPGPIAAAGTFGSMNIVKPTRSLSSLAVARWAKAASLRIG